MGKLNKTSKIYTEQDMANAFKAGHRLGVWNSRNNASYKMRSSYRMPDKFKVFIKKVNS